MYLWSAAKQGYFWKQLDVYFKCFEKVLCSWTISFWVLSMFWEWWNKYVSKEYKEFWHALIPALAWVLIPSAESSVLSLKLCVPCVTLIETQGHQSAPVWELLLRFLVNYCLTANSYITVQKKKPQSQDETFKRLHEILCCEGSFFKDLLGKNMNFACSGVCSACIWPCCSGSALGDWVPVVYIRNGSLFKPASAVPWQRCRDHPRAGWGLEGEEIPLVKPTDTAGKKLETAGTKHSTSGLEWGSWSEALCVYFPSAVSLCLNTDPVSCFLFSCPIFI